MMSHAMRKYDIGIVSQIIPHRTMRVTSTGDGTCYWSDMVSAQALVVSKLGTTGTHSSGIWIKIWGASFKKMHKG